MALPDTTCGTVGRGTLSLIKATAQDTAGTRIAVEALTAKPDDVGDAPNSSNADGSVRLKAF